MASSTILLDSDPAAFGVLPWFYISMGASF